jgi:signal transduction histidine kinase
VEHAANLISGQAGATLQRALDEIKRIRSELRLSEESRRMAMESGRMGAWQWDLREGRISGDAVFIDLFALPPTAEPVSLESLTRCMSAAGVRELRGIAASGLPSDGRIQGEWHLECGPAAGRWIRWRGRGSATDAGIIIGVAFDATDRKTSEQALRETEDRLRNANAVLATRIKEVEAANRTIRQAKTATLNLLEDAVAARDTLLAEVTERKRAEEALRSSEERLRTVFNSMGEAFVIQEAVSDSQGQAHDYRFVECNPAFAGQTGIPDPCGHTLREIMPNPDPLWFENYGEVLRTGQPAHFQAYVPSLDRWFRVSASRIGGPGSIRLAIVLSDISESKGAEAALRESREQLQAALAEAEAARAKAEAAGDAKDHFLAVLSHELRTPLTPVYMAVHSLLRENGLPPDVRESLVLIQRNIRMESRLIDELLDITRIERGKMELLCEPLNVQATLKQAIQVAAPDMEAKEQLLTVVLDPAEAVIQGDSMRLEQVFWNVLKNASKFTPEKGEIYVQSQVDAEQITITIRDSGRGIDQASLLNIFDPFTQADLSIAREFGGLGLGLSLARAIVEGHGGSIDAQSDGSGQGSIFSIRLPLSREGSPAKPAGSA